MFIIMAGCQQEVHLPLPLTLGRNRTIGVVVPDVSQSLPPASSSRVPGGTYPKF